MTTANAGNQTAGQTEVSLDDERVRLLYRLSRAGYVGTVLAALLVGVAAHDVLPQATLIGWLLLVGLITGGRLVLYRRFVALPAGTAGLSRWGRAFVAGALTMGCLWGALGVLWLPRGNLVEQLLAVFVLAVVMVMAAVVLAPRRVAFSGFAVAALLPLWVTTLQQPGLMYWFAAGAQLLFAVVVCTLAEIMHRAHNRELRLRYSQQLLVSQLSAANLALNERLAAQCAIEEELRASTARLDALVEATPLAIIVQDGSGVVSRWNRAAERIFGWRQHEVIGGQSPNVPADRQAEKLEFLQRIKGGQEFLGVDVVRQRRDGRLLSVSLSAAPLRAADGTPEGSIILLADVSERRRAEQLQSLEHIITRVLSESQSVDEALRDILRTFCQIADWDYGARWTLDPAEKQLRCIEIWHVDDAAVAAFAAANRASSHAFNPREGGLLGGVWMTNELVWMEDAAANTALGRAAELAPSGLHAALAFPILILGKFYGVIEFMAVEPRPRDDHLIRIARSIGSQIGQFIARKEAEQDLTFFANHDTLTGLPNRAMFGQRLTQALARAQRSVRMIAVLFVDLDRFKVINDTLGHDAGDQLLQQAAARLRACLREGDTIARQGGDEFVVLVEDMADVAQATGVAQKIIDNVAQPYVLAGQECHVTASVGVSVFPDDALDVATLLTNADLAMYRAKEAGKNNFQFYAAQDNQHTLERLGLETDLRRAIEHGELSLHYQPKINTRSGCITGVEALVRWQHPQRGNVSPAQFIPLAEENGFIVTIDDWVTATACRDACRWAAAGLPVVPVAVNLSARQFGREGLAERIAASLSESGLEARYLELEITESAVMGNAERAVAILDELHAIGVRVALDDFGTGYSSLGYLKRFPVDSVKIDRSFIANLPHDQDDIAITRAVIAMAHSLRLKVVAEGVETEAQERFLREHDCDEMQGYRFGQPCDAAALARLLAAPPLTPSA